MKQVWNRLNNLDPLPRVTLCFGISISLTLILLSLSFLILENLFLPFFSQDLFQSCVQVAIAVLCECIILSAAMDIYTLKVRS
jgi:hypothetical protein